MQAAKLVAAIVLVLACSLGYADMRVAPTATTDIDAEVPADARAFTVTNHIIVEFDPFLLEGTLEDLVKQIATRSLSRDLALSLGDPIGAQLADIVRKPASKLAELTADDPEFRLQNIAVLEYASDNATESALKTLSLNNAVLSVSRNAVGRYSIDPLVDIAPDHTQYQWGHYAMNTIQPGNQVGVWANGTGHAYVGVLDNGLKTAGGVHPDLAGSYRPHLSQNFGYAANGPTGGSLSPSNLDETPYASSLTPNTAGHGTLTAGVIAAHSSNGVGGAGVCPTCSLLIGRVSRVVPDGPTFYRAEPDASASMTAITSFTSRGAQVINSSFQLPQSPAFDAVLQFAALRDVVVVAASGNTKSSVIDYPARSPYAIAAGGISHTYAFWDEDVNNGSNWSTTPKAQHFVAPARNVVSTAYTGFDWYPLGPYNCGDNYPPGFSAGYGTCTGTSFAAPHVAGLIGLLRSIDPLRSRSDVRHVLAATSNLSQCSDNSGGTKCALGVPDSTKAVSAMLGGTNVLNRRVPLFSFYSTAATNHFYATAPQMAMAALQQGALLPQPASGTTVGYQAIGNTLSQYASFPVSTCSPSPCSSVPRAIALILSTKTNPNSGAPLVPLYRLSFRCGDELLTAPPNPQNPVCASNPSHLSHFYTPDPLAVAAYSGTNVDGVYVGGGLGYKVDGVEGYLFPTSLPQPSGTVRMCRKYDAIRDDYVLFPGTGSGGLTCTGTTDGFSGGNYNQNVAGTDWIGWVYPVSASIGSTQTNAAPSINMTYPIDGATIPRNTSFTFSASASDSDGSINNVRFFVDQQMVSPPDTGAPFATSWSSGNNGSFLLTAVATDNRGAVKASTSRTINITNQGSATLVNGGFESPTLGVPYQFAPSGFTWVFTPSGGLGGSGVSQNGSPFTFQNPPAPGGSQVAFMQGAVSISQTINFQVTGTYVLKFAADQRQSNQTTISVQVKVGNTNVGPPITPTKPNYTTYTSEPFSITSTGNKTITLLGINDGWDNTIFFDQVVLQVY